MTLEFGETKPNYEARKTLIQKVESIRRGRKLVCVLNLDRMTIPIGLHLQLGITTQFAPDCKEVLYRVLKELPRRSKIDLLLYTRGGDVNAVWPFVNLVREVDPDYEVLVPFRCHSAGTLVSLGAKAIWMGPLSELSPIDPTIGNQFNPIDPLIPGNRLAISVEDVQQYREFVTSQVAAMKGKKPEAAIALFERLTRTVHPLALGNVHRTHQQIKQLAINLLRHQQPNGSLEKTVIALTSRFHSHQHMIDRGEAKKILQRKVRFADEALAGALDELLRGYEDAFRLRSPFSLARPLGDEPAKAMRFIGGVAESGEIGYLFETLATVKQRPKIPPGVQIQVPAGQPLPLLPQLSREFEIEITAQGWVRNKEPRGATT
jgi:hypothetical protein